MIKSSEFSKFLQLTENERCCVRLTPVVKLHKPLVLLITEQDTK